jgi:hypothetical protein
MTTLRHVWRWRIYSVLSVWSLNTTPPVESLDSDLTDLSGGMAIDIRPSDMNALRLQVELARIGTRIPADMATFGLDEQVHADGPLSG